MANTKQKNPPATGYEVFHWPETQALLKRLGFPIDLPIRDVDIHIPFEGVASYTANLLGVDASVTQEVKDNNATT